MKRQTVPLLDHFHQPLIGQRHSEGFHGRWAAAISDALNESLPDDYFAEFQITLGTRIEVDVATFDEEDSASPHLNGTATAVQTLTWAPPAPAAVMPGLFPDDFEVRIFSNLTGPTLVAAIELISPRNKDRDESRRAFATKCAAYLQHGIGLIIVDIVPSCHANLHDELVKLLGHDPAYAFPEPTPLYATAYRPAHRHKKSEIDLWREQLEVGKTLPTLPLAVRGLGCLPIDLELTYMEARQRGRIG